MRKPVPAAAAARNALPASGKDGSAPVRLVCLALLLSVLVLGCRVASIW
jgi:hypothetical protein